MGMCRIWLELVCAGVAGRGVVGMCGCWLAFYTHALVHVYISRRALLLLAVELLRVA